MVPIHQVLLNSILGDPVSERARRIANGMKCLGRPHQLYAMDILDPFYSGHFYSDPSDRFYSDPPGHCEVKPAATRPLDSSSIVLFHSSVENSVYGSIPGSAHTKKVLIRHSSPAASYFLPYSHRFQKTVHSNRDFLISSKDSFDLAITDSEVSKAELFEYGYQKVEVLPLLVTPRDFTRVEPDPLFSQDMRRRVESGVKIFLMGGVFSPDQRFEEGIRLFAWYRRFIRPQSLLFIQGRKLPEEDYVMILKDLICSLGLQDSVFLRDQNRMPELKACYQNAHLFLDFSESECPQVQLREAIAFGIPVLSSKSEASVRFWGEKGFFATQMDIPIVAELVEMAVKEGPFREKMIACQKLSQKQDALSCLGEDLDSQLASKLLSFISP